MESPLPIWAQIIITITAAIVVASPFALILFVQLRKAIPQFASAVQTISQNQKDIAPKLDENADLLKKLVEDRANQDMFTQALVKRLWDTIDGYKLSINELKDDVSALQLQLRDREVKSAENKRLIEDLTADSQAKQKEQVILQAQVDKLQQDSDSIKQQLTESEAKRTEALTKLDEALQRIAQLESEGVTTAAEKERLTKELEAERAKVTELQAKVTHLEQEVARLKAELEAKSPAALPIEGPIGGSA